MIMKLLMTLLFLFFHGSSAFAWTSWVGVLEDWPVTTDEKQEPSNSVQYEARVRPLFIRVDSQKWQAAPRPGEANPAAPLPKAFSWDVCFSGRGEGQLTAMLIADGMPTTTPPYILRSEDRAPWRTRRSSDYAGWLPTPVYKPILLMSSLNSSCKDPEKWKQAGAEKAKAKIPAMIATLREKFATAEPGFSPYEFNDKNVKVFRSWVSPKQGLYVALKTKIKDSPIETFRLSPDGLVSYLGRDMMLVDSGDFDGDGATELLFKRRAEKKDIYELIAKGERAAESIWDYP
jgi:hypothetical protein